MVLKFAIQKAPKRASSGADDGDAVKEAHASHSPDIPQTRSSLFQTGDAEAGSMFQLSCPLGVNQTIRVACIFNSNFAADLQLPLAPMTFVQVRNSDVRFMHHGHVARH